MKKALLLVDLQNDFMPYGSLPVPNGDQVVEIANKLMESKYFDLVIATKDWHPADHKSFAINHPDKNVGDVIELHSIKQILWPPHCVQNSKGAEFHPALKKELINKIIFKGTDPNIDSYSGFYDNGRKKSTGLANYLKESKVTNVYIMGLATDYCVKWTALDSVSSGFTTWLIIDGCRGVGLNPNDINDAISEMQRKGVAIITSSELI